MARTVRNKPTLTTTYRTATGPRNVPLTDPQGHRLQSPIEIGGVSVYSRDANSVVFIPSCRFWTDGEEDDELDASWREESQAFNCFKTSYAYNMIGEEHPRIVPILGQDAWTGLPILPKPSGGSLENFLERHGDQLYAARSDVSSPPTRIKPEFLPLAYQWSLQLLSALSFLHSHNIAYGELLDANCWLSEPSLSVALAGFLGSDFSDSASGRNLPGIFFSGYEFSPASLPFERAISVPTAQTDMFMFGRLVYEIMTSYIPGYGIGRDWGETQRLMREQDWLPDLEDEFMGEILHKCWKFEYEEIEELQSEVQSFVESRGWTIRGDELEGLDVDSIRQQLEVRE